MIHFMTSILIILFFIQPSASAAQTILLQAENTSNMQYQSYLISNSSYLSFVEHYLETHPLRTNIKRLEDKFSLAQQFFIDGQKVKAANLYSQLISMQHLDDWKQPQRTIIFISFIRLASMQDNEFLKDNLIKQALYFNSEQDLNQKFINEDMKQYLITLKVQLKSSQASFDLSTIKIDYPLILINGQKIINNTVSSSNQTVRVSFISNKFPTKVITSRLDQILNNFSTPAVLSNGNCQSPLQLNSTQWHTITQKVSVLYPDKCLARYKSKNNLLSVTNMPRTQHSKSWLKRNWKWLSVVASAAAIPILHYSQRGMRGEKQKTIYIKRRSSL